MAENVGYKPFWKGLFTSTFVFACIGFFGLDAYIKTAAPLKRFSIAGIHRTETFGSDRAFRRLKEKPSVVLLGSSLVACPVLQAEANYMNANFLRNTHRRSLVMESALPADSRGIVFNYSVAGCLMSDAYFIGREVLERNAPNTIIYGIAPRDLIDNVIPGIETTEIYRMYARPEDLVATGDIVKDSPDRRLDLMLERLVGTYRWRSELAQGAILRTKKLMEKTLPWVAFGKVTPCGVYMEVKGFKFPEENVKDQVVYPEKELGHNSKEETTKEYVCRYREMRASRIAEQLGYLDKLAKLCQQKHTQLVVVNMPLSERNRAVMPDGLERLFAERTQQVCINDGARYVDWSRIDLAKGDDDFIDGVHLTSGLSIPFVKRLATLVPATSVATVNRRTW